MLHKVTALILSCFILVVAATSGVGLRFCLCEKTFFTGDCPCAQFEQSASSVPSNPSSDCCDCCAVGNTAENSGLVVNVTLPCDDCVVDLDLGLDQCVPQSGLDFKLAGDGGVTLVYAAKNIRSDEILLDSLNPADRAIPPPYLVAFSVPVYLRNQVILI